MEIYFEKICSEMKLHYHGEWLDTLQNYIELESHQTLNYWLPNKSLRICSPLKIVRYRSKAVIALLQFVHLSLRDIRALDLAFHILAYTRLNTIVTIKDLSIEQLVNFFSFLSQGSISEDRLFRHAATCLRKHYNAGCFSY